jgi:hypothetical protein
MLLDAGFAAHRQGSKALISQTWMYLQGACQQLVHHTRVVLPAWERRRHAGFATGGDGGAEGTAAALAAPAAPGGTPESEPSVSGAAPSREYSASAPVIQVLSGAPTWAQLQEQANMVQKGSGGR